MIQKRMVTEKLVKRSQDRGDFDKDFWEKVGPEGRFAAAWEMIVEADLFKGKNASQPRLQRSIQNIQRRKR
jgi:hypothetical protein